MKYMFTIICSIILPVLSLNGLKPKFCSNCKYFIKDNINGEDKFGKCSLFPKIENNNYFLVSGIAEDIVTEYYYCSTIINDYSKCGIEGKMHLRKYNKKSKNLKNKN